MPVYSFPDTYAEELNSLDGPIQPASLGIGGIQAITERGPVAVPIRTRSFASWKRIFGGYVSYSDAAYEAKAFFDEGGFELITVRQAHFSSIADKTTFTGVPASRMLLSGGTPATAATHDSGIGPFNLVTSGLTMIMNITGGGNRTTTITATSTQRKGADATFNLMNTKTLVVSFDGGPQQTVTFTAGATDADSTCDEINAQIYGGYASVVDTNEVGINTDTKGSSGTVQFHAASTALTELGFTSGTTTNLSASNVSNLRAVTAAEMKTLIDATTSSIAVVVVNSDGSFTVSSPTTGTGANIIFTGTALTILGFSAETVTGTAAGPAQNTLKVEAGYKGYRCPGIFGNSLKVQVAQTPLHPSAGANNDLADSITATNTTCTVQNPKGIQADTILKFTDGTNTEYKIVQSILTTVSGGVVTHTVTPTVAFVNNFVKVDTTVTSMEFNLYAYENGLLVESWTNLSMLDTADNYVETIINDDNIGSSYFYVTDQDAAGGTGYDTPAVLAATLLASGTDDYGSVVDVDWIGDTTGGTGLYAWDLINEFMPFALVKLSTTVFSAAVFHSAALYAKSRIWFDFVETVAVGTTASAAIAYRNSTLGINSSYAFLYTGGIKVVDANGSGSNPKKSIKGVGAIMGVMSRVDTLPTPNGGPWQSPAGEGDYGKINSALDVVDSYSKEDCGLMNDAHINVFIKFTNTSPVTIWGARTLDSSATQEFRYINTRRTFQYFEKSIVDGTRWGVFRNNDFKLWGRLKDRITEFLTDKLGEGAFPTSDSANAFYVLVGITDGVMDAADRDVGKVIGKIGLAPHKPGEFIIFQFAQYSAGLEVTEG